MEFNLCKQTFWLFYKLSKKRDIAPFKLFKGFLNYLLEDLDWSNLGYRKLVSIEIFETKFVKRECT